MSRANIYLETCHVGGAAGRPMAPVRLARAKKDHKPQVFQGLDNFEYACTMASTWENRRGARE
jgi:hypothetical protein